MLGETQSGQFLVAPPAYLVYPLDLPVYGQVIQGGAGGALMSWHVHADQVQVLRKELRTHRTPRDQSVCVEHVGPCSWGGCPDLPSDLDSHPRGPSYPSKTITADVNKHCQ